MDGASSTATPGNLSRQMEQRLPDLPTDEVPVLVGPTGVGKSRIALELARRQGGEIISMDSRAVYRGMDIGTAKPAMSERDEIRHHLLDILDPCEPRYSAGRFFADACRLVADIKSRGKLPLVVGGTMMYANALVNGLVNMPSISPAMRAKASKLVARLGLSGAHAELGIKDPLVAGRIHTNDHQRLVRAWEVLLATGKPLGEWLTAGNNKPDFPLALYALVPADKKNHRNGIKDRLDRMIANGLVREVSYLVTKCGPDAQALNTIGYRQLLPFVLGKVSLNRAASDAKRATTQLARRQMGWIRKFGLPRTRIIPCG